MAERCERVARRLNAAITAAEGAEAALYAKWSTGDRKKELLRRAEVSRRQARMLRGGK